MDKGKHSPIPMTSIAKELDYSNFPLWHNEGGAATRLASLELGSP